MESLMLHTSFHSKSRRQVAKIEPQTIAEKVQPPLREDPQLAEEAKAIVSQAFRNGPLEGIHAGKQCPVCAGDPSYSHISDNDMKMLMQIAVDYVYLLLVMRYYDPQAYLVFVDSTNRLYTLKWDNPTVKPLDSWRWNCQSARAKL